MTVVRRTVRSSPHRDTVETWTKIVDLLTRGNSGPQRDELLSVQNVASAMIAERAPEGSPIVVVCKGPRTRIYCTYDEKSIDGSDAQEDAFSFDPLNGDWTLSLPAPTADLAWVQEQLSAKSKRITARDVAISLKESDSEATAASSFTIDREGLLNL